MLLLQQRAAVAVVSGVCVVPAEGRSGCLCQVFVLFQQRAAVAVCVRCLCHSSRLLQWVFVSGVCVAVAAEGCSGCLCQVSSPSASDFLKRAAAHLECVFRSVEVIHDGKN